MGNGERAGKRTSFKWAGAHESMRAASEFQSGQGRWRTNHTDVHRGLVVATRAALLIGSTSSTTTTCVTAENCGSSRRGDLVKPVLSGSKELVAERTFYSNRGPILWHQK